MFRDLQTTTLLTVLALASGLATPTHAQESSPKAILVSKPNAQPVRIASPVVMTWSNLGYILGGAFSRDNYILVTDAVHPPEGVTLELRQIKLTDVKALEWDPLPTKATSEDWHQFKTTVLYVDGRKEHLFAWIQMRDRRQKLFPCALRIVGTIELGGKKQTVSMGMDEKATGTCESVSLSRLEFEW